MNKKLLVVSLVFAVLLILHATTVSAISTFLNWPDGTSNFQTVSASADLDVNYTVTLVSTHQANTAMYLVKDSDFANPVTTLLSTTHTGLTYGQRTIQANDLVGNSQYTVWLQSTNQQTAATSFDLLSFQTQNTAPQFNSSLQLAYQYDLAQVSVVNVVDLAQFAYDVDGDSLSFTLDTTNTDPNVVSCQLTAASVLNCNLQGVGTTTVLAEVSDGSLSSQVLITITVIDTSNTAPQFDQNMTLQYTYNINLGSVSVVDLATVASDADNDPLSFSLDQSATNQNIVSCQLTGSSVLDCNLNGVGTTSLDAIVSDGQATDLVTIQITVLNTTTNTAPFFNNSLQLNYVYPINLGNVNVVDLSLFGIDPENDPLTYSLNTAATNTNIVACTLLSGTTVNCNLNGVGTTSLDAIVSDGQFSTPVTLTITVINTTTNNAPFFNSSLQLNYVYDLAVTSQAQLVDLSLFGIDPDNDPLTYSLNTAATNPAVTSCTLVAGSLVNCIFTGVGTTSLDAIVSDGQLSTAVTLNVQVINSTPANNPPFYVNIAPVTVAPTGMQFIFDLQANSVDPDNDPVTNGFNLGLTNPNIVDFCMVIGSGQLYCNVVGSGSTAINISVSDGQATTYDMLPITSLSTNTAPFFNSSLQLSYTYNINLGSVNVVDLADFAIDMENDPLTFSLDTTFTDPGVVSCNLLGPSDVVCSLNGVGTTTMLALVSDGQAFSAVTLTITVFQPGPQAPVAVITSPGTRLVCESDETIAFDGSASFSPDGRQLINYYWTVLDMAGTVVAQSNAVSWTMPSCFDEGRYEVYLSVVDTDGLVGTSSKLLRVYEAQDFSDSNEEGLKVSSVEVWGTDFETACVAGCGKNQLEVIAVVENKNSFTIDDLRMTYTIPEYGVRYTSAEIEVTPGDQTTIELLVELPFDIEPGIYYPTISFSDGELRRVKPGYLEIQG